MKRYLQILKISFAQEFAYKLNFVLWRLRNVVQILVFYFLWEAVFSNNKNEIFGYDREKILTYAFALILIRALILSSRSNDLASQIADGSFSNQLLKPVNFFRYWITRDIGSKLLNIFFGFFEILFLLLLLKPPIYIQSDFSYIVLFIASLIIAIFLYFCISMLTNYVSFWLPELHWGAQFLVLVIAVEFLSGSFFPIDVLPNLFYRTLLLTPFPYLIYFPIQIYLGNIDVFASLQSIGTGMLWVFILWKLTKIVWYKGLISYESVGR